MANTNNQNNMENPLVPIPLTRSCTGFRAFGLDNPYSMCINNGSPCGSRCWHYAAEKDKKKKAEIEQQNQQYVQLYNNSKYDQLQKI